MENISETIFITIPVGDAVVQNLTDDVETRWMKMLFKAIQQSNMPKDYYNVAILLLILSMITMLTIRFIVKRRHHFRCIRKEEVDSKQHSDMLK